MSNFPDATNTGVPAGVTLTPSGSLVINTPGVIISGLDIKGSVYINASDVTLINCRITSNNWSVVQIASAADGVVIKNCEINGVGSGNDGSNGIAGHGTFVGNNIYNVENGISLQGSNSLVQDNYIHDLRASGSPHYDGIQVDGGNSNIVIRHNTVINDYSQTSAVMIDNYFGPISNIVVDGNLLIGGGYTIYVDGQFNSNPISNVSITNNHMGSGYWGITYFNRTSPTYSGNINDGLAIEQSLGSHSEDITPTPTITSFSTDSNVAGDGITNDNTLRLTGAAPVDSTVRVYDKGTQIGSTTANSSGTWSYTTGTVANGSHSFTATATSGGTTSAASSPLSVTVDTIAPAAPIIVSNSINTNGVTLNGTAEPNSTVRVYDGSTQIGTASTNGSGTWNYTTGTLSSATHSFTARAMDTAGNTGASSAALAAPTVAAPTIASFSTDSGAVGDRITNDATIALSGSAPTNSTVRIYDNGTLLGQTTANGSGVWNYTTRTLSNATHSFTATATSGGTTSAASSPLSVTVDTIAPAAPIIVSNSINTNGVTLNGTAEPNSTVRVYDGSTQIGTASTNGSGTWNYTTGTLSSATHSFTARAMDTAGNTGASSAALAVTVNTVGTPTTFTGTSGNDVQEGTIGADTLMGGAGNDTYTVNHIGDKVVEFANQGTDKVESTISYTLADNIENLQLMGGAKINGTGNGLNNTIIGNDVSNTLMGGAGSDTLNGWGGGDTLFGGSGNDVFQFSSQFSADGDTVADFSSGQDKLDFSKIDANAWNAGDQAFVFDGYTNGGSNGHLWASEDQLAGVTHVYGKTGDFQFHIDLQGTRLGLTASNFTL